MSSKQNILNYYLEKPDIEKLDKSKILEKLEKTDEVFYQFLQQVNEPKYLYWDKIKYLKAPSPFSIEESWYLIRQFRILSSRPTPIKTEDNQFFKWIKLSYLDEFLHQIDINSGGQIFASIDTLNSVNKQKYLSQGILEEAIASSQLEGAHTTRNVAKQMIVNKRQPRNKDEQMILNNYQTIIKIDSDYKNKTLSKEMIFELHRMLTDKTIDNSDVSRYRLDSDDIVVQGDFGGEQYITHTPPSEKFIEQEMSRLIDYANNDENTPFVHPVVKAIFLHFWIGYLHPFVDGNGRLARAIFYWYLLRKNYWTFMYLPISLAIKKAPIQYAQAYIYSEQDNLDLTYFFDFHVRKILQALDDFKEYLDRKTSENRQVDNIINQSFKLTERQKYLVHNFISDLNFQTTVTSHSVVNNISRQTAAKDIQKLVTLGYISGHREGKYIKFRATPKLLNLVNRI